MKKTVWVLLRLSMGFIFLWAFVDKLLGLGYATPASGAWIKGASPTTGFLLNATHGPFVEFFQGLVGLGVSGINLIDWVFMVGLLFVGLTLIINRYVVWGALAGSIMLLLMFLAAFPAPHNPVLDDHIVYIFVLALLAIRSKERYR